MKKILLTAIILLTFTISPAQSMEEYVLKIKDHRFIPETLIIPAGEKVKIKIFNEDQTPEEFESYELNREKIIRGNSKAIIFVGPLKAGEYPFFGEFNMDTAQGKIVVEE